MKPEIPLNSADEQDALTKWRLVLNWRPGQRKKIKNGYQKRVRQWIKLKLNGFIK